MARVRRTVYALFHCHDGAFLEIGDLLRGTATLTRRRQINALSILRGEEVPVTPEELDLLLSFPSDEWVDGDGVPPDAVHELAHKGLLLTDEDDGELAELRRRDERLRSGQWNLYAALFHFMTRWRDVDLRVPPGASGDAAGELLPITLESVRGFVELHGTPPPPFHSAARSTTSVELPLVTRSEGLFAALERRRTTRGFDRDSRMTLDELALVLYYVFGCHGYVSVVPELLFIKRTSPSGGGLHPVEAYPLVTRVEGVEPGLYHYSVRDHALELVTKLDEDEATELATRFVCGQAYFGSAHVSVVLAARFFRTYWKYRKHQKAYAAVLMDAAHLSQTLYLVSAELGLGAFVTAAVNGLEIEEKLGLDGYEEGVLAVAGCGRRRPERTAFEPEFESYVPRETALP